MSNILHYFGFGWKGKGKKWLNYAGYNLLCKLSGLNYNLQELQNLDTDKIYKEKAGKEFRALYLTDLEELFADLG